ncbi:MAG: hypothetical protein IJ821_02420 [Lachnospiraceae bacterium]|nr:hypothetical protein [Lachnospiraceae bacterium]
MKNWITFFTLLFIIIGCASWRNVEKQARDHATVSLLNNSIEQFSTCYFRLPKDKEELVSFVSEWKIKDSLTYLYDVITDSIDYIEYLKRDDIKFKIMKDSLFVFSKKTDIGCVSYNSPLYWLRHPKHYPYSRSAFIYGFTPAAYDLSGKYCFHFDFDKYHLALKDIQRHYEYQIKFKIEDGIVPFYIVIRYDIPNATYKIISGIPEDNTRLILISNKDDGYIKEISINSISELQSICSFYIGEITNTISELITDNEATHSSYMILPLQAYF